MKLRNKNTGDVTEIDHISIPYRHNNSPCLSWITSIAQLNEKWEDYKPAEPLIKDEKIRKAVRAWAEANDIGVVKFRAEEHRLFDKNVAIEFDVYFFEELQDGWNYTIAELCGEWEDYGGKDVRRHNPLSELSPYDYSKRNIVTNYTDLRGKDEE